ncbi:ComF family protein, partial [Candidatus Dojkabacteria bacterium]|nr:ComF family protein [Candidatus Dojkabacteria bacterium]
TMLKNVLKNLVRALFPEWCIGCGYPGQLVCPACRRSQLAAYTTPQCHVCRQQIYTGLVHHECRQATYLDGVWVTYVYDELAHKLVQQLKYSFNLRVASVMAEMMTLSVLPWGLLDDSVLTFVPITGYRQRWRGFNQAELLAIKIAGPGRQQVCKLLIRKGRRHTQVGMNKDERQQNLHGSIEIAPSLPGKIPRKVVLVDDVMTTGSTLEVCAKVLKQAGAEEVYGLVFARG